MLRSRVVPVVAVLVLAGCIDASGLGSGDDLAGEDATPVDVSLDVQVDDTNLKLDGGIELGFPESFPPAEAGDDVVDAETDGEPAVEASTDAID
ncbi:MAG: hypothetical protein ACHREM_29520 [Polyangiales bacterium]